MSNTANKMQSPRVMTGPVTEAHVHALAQREPVFVPAKHHADDRGWSIMNQLQGVLSPQGQINFSVQYPGVIKGWHRHQKQTDFWLCLLGHIKAGVWRENDSATWSIVLGEKNPGLLVIPPGLWHGAATIGPREAGLLYYVTHPYDPQHPDEDRRPYDSVPGFSWDVQHR